MAAKPGLMEMADGGTLFLDEVGELPLGLQPKLLRVLQEKEHRRLGGVRTIKFAARTVVATNRDLHQRVKEGEFREDLLFRLNVIPIQLPPLRERHGDVPLLANWFLESCSERDTGMSKSFDPEVLRALESYSWPGVRELQNVVRRMCVLADGPCYLDARSSGRTVTGAQSLTGRACGDRRRYRVVRTWLRRGKDSIC
jgi:transcriptional regulator with GAF, ATPase, and Fis domain